MLSCTSRAVMGSYGLSLLLLSVSELSRGTCVRAREKKKTREKERGRDNKTSPNLYHSLQRKSKIISSKQAYKHTKKRCLENRKGGSVFYFLLMPFEPDKKHYIFPERREN